LTARLTIADVPSEEWRRLADVDCVLAALLRRGGPITRDRYLALACPDNLPDDWGAELEGELPCPLRRGAFDDQDWVTEQLGIIDHVLERGEADCPTNGDT